MKSFLICLADSKFYKPNMFSSNEYFLSPDEQNPNNISTFRIPAGSSDIKDILNQYPSLPKNPDFIVIKTDALKRNFVKELSTLNCPVIISVADTHHLHRPLEAMIDYLKNEKFTLVSIENDRHHLKWYKRAGIENLCWLPNLFLSPIKMPVKQDAKDCKINFVGSMGRFHVFRSEIIKYVATNIPDFKYGMTQTREAAASVYNNSIISLNVSLNGDLNWRFFEILAASGFLLTDRLTTDSGIYKFMSEGVHFECYSSEKELLSKIKYYLKYPEEALLIAKNGHQLYCDFLEQKILVKEMIQRVWLGKEDNSFSFNENIAGLGDLCHLRAYQAIQEIHRLSISVILTASKCLFQHEIMKDISDFPRIKYDSLTNSSYLQAYEISSQRPASVLLVKSLEEITYFEYKDKCFDFIVSIEHNENFKLLHIEKYLYSFDPNIDCYKRKANHEE